MKVLVTGATRNTGTAAAYALAKEGCHVIGCDEIKLPFNIHSRNTKSFVLHAPFSDKNFYSDILSIIKKEEPDVILPVGGTRQISLHKEEIKKHVNAPVPDYESFISAYNKRMTHEICSKLGISAPHLFSYTEAYNYLKKNKNNNLVIKPGFDAGGARGLKIINYTEQLESVSEMLHDNSKDYIIEEYIPGAKNMRAVQLVFDRKNNIAAKFILKKIHQFPVKGGITAYAETSHEWELIDFVLPFFEKYQWEGPVELEIIIDERDGKPKLIEINPRFAGSLFFAVQSGVNLPYITCLTALGETGIKPPAYNKGLYYINYSYYFRTIFNEYFSVQNKSVYLNKVLQELKRKKVHNYPDKKDSLFYFAKAFRQIPGIR